MIEWRQFKKISCKLANQAETNPYLNRLKLCVCVCVSFGVRSCFRLVLLRLRMCSLRPCGRWRKTHPSFSALSTISILPRSCAIIPTIRCWIF